MSFALTRESLRDSGVLAFTSAVGIGFVAWSSTQLYVAFCAPQGLTGFVTSLITMDSSPCQAIFSIISHSKTLYGASMASLLLGVIAVLTSFFSRKSK